MDRAAIECWSELVYRARSKRKLRWDSLHSSPLSGGSFVWVPWAGRVRIDRYKMRSRWSAIAGRERVRDRACYTPRCLHAGVAYAARYPTRKR